MKFIQTPFKDLFIIELEPFIDDRGQFTRLFCKKEFKEIGFNNEILQINHSLTKKKGSFRGLHYQTKSFSEIKIIRCLKGSAYDIVVDIREDSATFLQCYAIKLQAENNNMIFIPEGFAHGFQTLEDNTELLYLHSEFYTPAAEAGLNIYDPRLNIELPLPVSEISDRDKDHPFIDNKFKGIE